jgi:hypothetical protein
MPQGEAFQIGASRCWVIQEHYKKKRKTAKTHRPLAWKKKRRGAETQSRRESPLSRDVIVIPEKNLSFASQTKDPLGHLLLVLRHTSSVRGEFRRGPISVFLCASALKTRAQQIQNVDSLPLSVNSAQD